ncbi:MAG TPA: phenylphosphate carboxylase subunit delta [Planctomycetaceae bacterium]|nr:phenylphosphate carboxylase subunit delta [Planctomycetaceae bacterium]HRE99846.1 phenylphosphate carboxylase subunit delta [Pirellulaceae bacterium]
MKLEARLQKIELILSDVDGVLTDGRLEYAQEGGESKRFHVRDGLGIKLWQRAGFRFGIVTARTSQLVKVRAAELGIELVRQGHEEKLPVVRQIVDDLGLAPEQLCYIGDDLPDLACIRFAGVGAAPADGANEVRAAATLTTRAAGGAGAVRELIETILKAQQRWDDLVRRYQHV